MNLAESFLRHVARIIM